LFLLFFCNFLKSIKTICQPVSSAQQLVEKKK